MMLLSTKSVCLAAGGMWLLFSICDVSLQHNHLYLQWSEVMQSFPDGNILIIKVKFEKGQ